MRSIAEANRMMEEALERERQRTLREFPGYVNERCRRALRQYGVLIPAGREDALCEMLRNALVVRLSRDPKGSLTDYEVDAEAARVAQVLSEVQRRGRKRRLWRE